MSVPARRFSAGEALTDTLVHRFRRQVSKACSLINLYGPTETTLAKCWYRVPDEPGSGAQPIGIPLPETQVLILDENGAHCADGMTGEIVIRTPHRTGGYLAQGGSERQAFRVNPHRSDPADQLFYTGDLGRIEADGLLHIAGRMDEQIKIRGVRVEPLEIIRSLIEHPGVSQAIVIAQGQENVQLTAFMVADKMAASRESIISHLKDRLPLSMIPHRYIYVPAMPTTERGKVNLAVLKALASPAEEPSAQTVPPQTGTERDLAALWASLLQCNTPGRGDNFMLLGGHSLLALRLVSRVREMWNNDFDVRDVFENLTLERMASRIDQTSGKPACSEKPLLPRADHSGRFPLSSSQRRLWFVSQLEPASGYYNIPGAVRFRGPLDLGILQRCINRMVDHHEPLRTRFEEDAGEPSQLIDSDVAVSIRRLDLQQIDVAERHAECLKAATEDARRPFDLAVPPLLRLLLIDLGDDDSVLVYTFSHLVADGWTNVIFIRELCRLYAAEHQSDVDSMARPAIQYADYAQWEQDQLAEHSPAGLEYWKSRLHGVPDRLVLPGDRPRPAVQTHSSAQCTKSLSAELSHGLLQLCRDHNVTLFIAVLALFKIVLYRASGERDLCIGTPVANRNKQALEDTFGCFINTLAIRTQMPNDCTFSEFLNIVRQNVFSDLAHQDTPFDKVVEAVGPVRSPGHHPLFQVLVNLLHWEEAPLALPEISARREWLVSPQTKFDMTLYIRPHDSLVDFHLVYNSDLFDAGRIEHWLNDLVDLLRQCLRSPADFRVDCLESEQAEVAGTARDDEPNRPIPGNMAAGNRAWSETERALAAIWRELLNLDEITLADNFFALGGYSMLAIRLVARIREQVGVLVPVWKLFEFPTIVELARFIDSCGDLSDAGEAPADEPVLLPAQHHLWKLHAEKKDKYHFNVPRAVRMLGELHYDKLQQAVNSVVQRHAALRTCYDDSGSEVIPRVLPITEVPIRMFDLRDRGDAGQRQEEALACIKSEMTYQFDLRGEVPLRIALACLAENEHVLIVTTHHIAADCWSMGLPFQALLDEEDTWHYGTFFRDLMHFYDRFTGSVEAPSAGQKQAVTEVPVDIFSMTREAEGLQDFPKALSFWQGYLQGASQSIHLPADDIQPCDLFLNGRRAEFAIDSQSYSRLERFSRQYQTTHFVSLFSAFIRSVRNWAGETDFLVGVPVSNRGTEASENLIGNIANTIVLRARFEEPESTAGFVRRLHKEIHETLAWQYYPFEDLVRHVGEVDESGRSPLYQIRFVFQHMPEVSPQSPGLVLRPIQFDRGVSKYDLSLVIAAQGNKLRGWCEYKTPLFKPSTIDAFVEQFLGELDELLPD
jgi:non-ribosomal peptide synthetase component F